MGEKFDIFVLDLSFLGWYLIEAVALGIGVSPTMMRPMPSSTLS